MSEHQIRTQAVSTPLFAGEGVSIVLAPPMVRFSLRARKAADLDAVVGIKVPDRIGTMQNGVACLGPDEWMVFAPDGTTIPFGEGRALAVTDVSDRSIGIILEGRRAAATLASGCPLDLDRFAVGRATRTVYETVGILVIREAADRFHVDVWRSFAPWLLAALVAAAAD